MASYNNKGHSKHTRHIRINHWMLKTDAWRSLKPSEIVVFLILLERYNGGNNGMIGLSIRDAARLAHISQNTASRCLNTLIDKGFVKRRYKGSFSQKARRASEYELTHVPYGKSLATKEFASWKKQNTASIPMRPSLNLGAISNEDVM